MSRSPVVSTAEVVPRDTLIDGDGVLRAQVMWIFAGSAVFAATQWLLLASMARRGSAALVGDWAFALAITAPVFVFAQLKLRSVLAADAGGNHSWDTYLSIRRRGMAFAMLLMAIVVSVGYRDITGILIVIVGLGKAVEGICDLLYGGQQRNGDMRGSIAGVRFRGGPAMSQPVNTAASRWMTGTLASVPFTRWLK